MIPTRGERNNNPGNIRKSPIAWRGEIPGSDSSFETFQTPELGIRALGKLLRHYVDEGFNTTRKIIERYAPHTENDTNAYLAAVCTQCKTAPETQIDLASDVVLCALVAAIITHENGRCIYSNSTIARSIAAI